MVYDIVIVGGGGVGCAAAFHAAKRGLRVLVLDRFPPGHDRGSSHGQTRIIRQAYFEHPDYVPLLFRAYDLWRELEEITGESLLQINGLIQIGPPNGEVIPGVLESARRWQLDIESLSEGDLAAHYPQFHLPENCQALYEAKAGILQVEKCVQSHAAAAQRFGAEFRDGLVVRSWQRDGQGIRINTDRGDFLAARAIISTGAWASDLLGQVASSLYVLRKHLHWFAVEEGNWNYLSCCPSFLYELAHGVFYGIPAIDNQGVKIGEHTGGAIVTNPINDDQSIELEDQRRVQEFVTGELNGLAASPTAHKTCFYTMSSDQHFIVGRFPDSERVAFACGLSGHGFKFTGALGEALVALALGEPPPVSVDFLSPGRFSPS